MTDPGSPGLRPSPPDAGPARPPELDARFAAGDMAALREAYDKHGSTVYGIALRGLGAHHDAEDVALAVVDHGVHRSAFAASSPFMMDATSWVIRHSGWSSATSGV